MKMGIVSKLFILTTALCTLILAIFIVGQTLFFKQYYAHQKIKNIQTNIQSYAKEYEIVGDDANSVQKLERDFYHENSTWVTTLDRLGNIIHSDDFSMEIQLDSIRNKDFSNRIINIPLYSLVDFEDFDRMEFRLEEGNRIFIDGLLQGDTVVPAMLTILDNNTVLENKQLSERLYGMQNISQPINESSLSLVGNIKAVQWQDTNSIYANRLFINTIKEFQAKLLFKEHQSNVAAESIVIDYEQNEMNFKILIQPIIGAKGEINYIFAMASLQPVDEAMEMIKDYYVYLFIFVFLLIILVSFYYSKKISKPLLQLNKATKKIADLDFSENITITTKDEIGDLSHNINSLSTTLHSHINQLQQDIEKEKQLENTRKDFIAGVSHELKTPLSVMKSCISILEDGVASHKKDYYFKAMSKEVDKMDSLIVDMLELAKFESGTYRMEVDAFYIDEIIEYICDQFTWEINNKQLHVQKQLSNIVVVANQYRIEQVITNFMTNAIRYTPENDSILISTIEENKRVKVCVENKGGHIAQEHIGKIWDRFYRVDSSRKRSQGGTGLGLAISKHILDLHGVQYGVSNTDDGVLFYFYLSKKGIGAAEACDLFR